MSEAKQPLDLSSRGSEIIQTVIAAYLAVHRHVPGTVLNPAEAKQLFQTWIAATRSVPAPSSEASNKALHWADYRQLGLVDDAGRAKLNRVREAAEWIFAQPTVPSFSQTLNWVEQQALADPQRNAAKVAQAKLKKQRKQAKLNRKRGRR